jgi:2-dehydro-3-deoxygluconokinase
VVTIGEAMLRLATPLGARLADAASLDVHIAGAEANVAAALAQLGTEVRWVSALPDNPLGRRVEAALRGCGVLLDGVEWMPGARLGLFFADSGADPRPTRVSYDRAGSAFTKLSSIPAGALAGARFVHVSGVTAAVAAEGLLEALPQQVEEAGAELSLDVNYRSLLWPPAAARRGLEPLLAAAGTVICGAADAAQVLRLEGDPAAVAEELRERWAPRARRVVLTLGAEGCLALDEDGVQHRHAAPPATMVDRFGVGDAFAAGLLWGLLEADLELALRAATALAALKATVSGDFTKTDRAELKAALSDERKAIVR